MGGWEKQPDETWMFKLSTGEYLKSSWIESLSEKKAFYYVNEYGIRVKDETHNGHRIGNDEVYRHREKTQKSEKNILDTVVHTFIIAFLIFLLISVDIAKFKKF